MKTLRLPFVAARLALSITFLAPVVAGAAGVPNLVATAVSDATARRAPVVRSASELPKRDHSRNATKIYGTKLPGALFEPVTEDDHLVLSNGFDTPEGTCDIRNWDYDDRADNVYVHVSDRFVLNRAFLSLLDLDGGAPFPATLPAPRSTTNFHYLWTIAPDDSGNVVVFAGNVSGVPGEGPRPYVVYSGSDLVRSYGPVPLTGMSVFDSAHDPVTGGFIALVSNADSRYELWLYPSGGGTPTHLAGNSAVGAPNADTTALVARITTQDFSIDNAGNIYFAQVGSAVIKKLRRNDLRVVTVAGTGVNGSTGDGGPALSARFNLPEAVASNPAGTTLYVLDTFDPNRAIRKIDLVSDVVSTEVSLLAYPSARDLTASGSNLYLVADGGGSGRKILRVQSGAVVAVAGADQFGATYDTPAHTYDPLAVLIQGCDLAGDGTGGLYVSNQNARQVYHLPPGGDFSLVAGVTSGGVQMGTRALWFGADENSAPEEVANWVQPYGFGDGWSQRFTSPSFSLLDHPAAVLKLDGTITLFDFDSNASLMVRAQKPDGSWVIVNHRIIDREGANTPFSDGRRLQLRGWFKMEVHFGTDGNELLGLGSSTRVQVVVQTRNQASMEDGFIPAQPGAAIIDNVALRDGGTDVLPALNFEDGSTGGWTLSALNGAYVGPALASDFFERDAAPNSNVDLRTGYDFADNDCVWTFASLGDTVSRNVWARLSSPWIPRLQPSGVLIIEFSGKLNTAAQRRVLDILVLGKDVGETHPHVLARPSFLLNGGISGGDLSAAYLTDQELLYPIDYSSFDGMDSVKVLFQIEGRREALPLIDAPGELATRLPYLDDLELYELGADASDYDGVPDIHDDCPVVFAAGEDADGDGCISPTASMRHIESWSNASLPIRFQLADNGDPDLPGNIELAQIRQGFAAWDAVPEANLSFVEGPTVPSGDANSVDGINLVTFEDDYDFAANVIAITTTTSFTRTTGFWDRVAIPGQIVDADIIFNTHYTFDIGTGPVPSGAKDLKSIATHEIGHMLGLSHSGVADATMYPILLSSRDAASLEDDDREAVSAAFPTTALTDNFGTLRGSVKKGTDSAPIPGALVMAMRLASGVAQDTVASDFTREDGTYAIYRLPPGSYGVRIVPLDGSVPGLLPRAIHDRVEGPAFTSFAPERYGGPESNSDDPTAITPIAVTAHNTQIADLFTNIDLAPPTVLSVAPAAVQDSVRIQSPVVINFSEPISATSLGTAFKLRKLGDTGTLGGLGNLIPPGGVFVFSPASPLAFGQTYEIVLTTALTDRDGNALAVQFTSTFLTETQPTVAILDIQPRQAPEGAYITISGVGINPADVQIHFAGAAVDVHEHAVSATPTSVVVQVPGYATDGPLNLVSDGEISNQFDFDVIVDGTFQVPNQLGDPVNLTFAPTDVALTPEGSTAVAVGGSGVAVINLSPARPNFRVPQYLDLPGARRVTLTPDGRRALVTVPSAGRLVIVDTDTSSATFGLVRGDVEGLASPDAVTTDQGAQRAWVTQQGGGQIFEVNIDPLNAGYPITTRTIDTGFTLTGGLSLTPQQSYLFATSSAGIVQVLLTTGAAALFQAPGFISPSTSNAIEVAPLGERLVAGGYGTSSNRLFSVFGGSYVSDSAFTLELVLGGTVRDVQIEPFGAKALVANSTLDLVQIVDIGGNFLTGQAVTPANPVALALNADGSLLAVATSGDPGVTFYSTSNSTQINTVAPGFARPGDQVVMRVTAPVFAPSRFQGPTAAGGSGSGGRTPFETLLEGSVVVGGVETPVTYSQLFATAFTVPPVPQQATSVSYQGAASTSGAVSFTVVDPIEPFQLRDMSDSVTTAGRSCPVPFTGNPTVTALAVSPNGRYLAVGGFSPCGSSVDIYDISGGGSGPFGQYIGSTTPFFSILTGLAFSAGSDNLYMTSSDQFDDAGSLKRYRFGGSPDSSQLFGVGTVALAVDPVGEYLAVLRNNGNIQFFDQNNLSNLGGQSFADAHSVAWTRDGHYLVVGRDGGIALIDRGPLTVTTSTTPSRAGAGSTSRLALTADGRRAVGITSTGALLMWSLEAGNLTSETFFQSTPPIASPSSVVPAPDGNGVLIGSSILTSVVKYETVPPGPANTVAATGPTTFLATTPDGRQLWVANVNSFAARVSTMSLATSMAVVAGDNLIAEAGAELPVPVTVKLSDGAGAPQIGVLVRFTIPGTDGSLDLNGNPVVERLTNAEGEASVRWIMPALPRSCTMEVVAPGVTGPLAIHATAAGDPSVAEPLVVGLGPADGATGIRSDGSMYVRFSQRMDQGSVTGGLQLATGAGPVGGVVEREDDYTFRFNPTSPLPFSANCTFRVNAGIVDLEGQTLAGASETHFTVEPEPTLALELITPPAAPNGAAIVLAGNGFSSVPAQNSVVIGGRLAVVSTATPTALVVTVPENAVSGDVTVQVGSNTSNPLSFVVLNPDAGAGGVLGDIPAGPGIRDIAVTSDGARTYVTNPEANSVAALDVQNATTLAIIPVGLTPQSIVILPGDRRAYVANTGSDNVSVIDIDPTSTLYHSAIPSSPGVRRPIPVGDQPIELAVAPFNQKVVVVNSGDSTISVIDTDPALPAADQVTSTIKLGGGGNDVAIQPEGQLAYIATQIGIEIVDIVAGSVVASIPIGGGGSDVAIDPDGALLFVLTGNDSLYVIDIAAGSETENRVIASIPIGGGGSDVNVQPDGTHVYVTVGDGDVILVFEIVSADEAGASIVPGPIVRLELVAQLEVGDSPAALAFAPLTGLGVVANEGDGTITLIGPPSALGALEFAMEFSPNTINLKSMGRYVQACIGPLDPYLPSDVVVSSIRLNDVVPAERVEGDGGCGPGWIQVKFSRAATILTLGDAETAPIKITGQIDGRLFVVRDTVKVKRGKVNHPNHADHVTAGSPFTILYDRMSSSSTHVAVVHSLDDGRTWTIDATNVPNTGAAAWTPPMQMTDSARVAIVEIEQELENEEVSGVLGVSERFSISGTTAIERKLPTALELSSPWPNPASGAVRFTFGLPVKTRALVEVFDVRGRRVNTLINGERDAGWHDVTWNGRDTGNGRAGPGLYFLRLRVGARELQRRVIWLE